MSVAEHQPEISAAVAHVGEPGLGSTRRPDRWWIAPVAVAIGLLVFTAYAAWAVLSGSDYQFGPYLSPFYSPLIPLPGGWISPAFAVLWAPLGFRLTCYYYRKAYYRAFFLSPPACAVSEAAHAYRGEAGALRWLPMLHRWFLYISIVVLAILWYDAVRAFDFDGHLGVGVGSIILLVNVLCLTFFTFGCHALRSAVGGNQRCLSCSTVGNVRYTGWRMVTRLTTQHPLWAWISLYTIVMADLYVRLLSLGVFSDPRIVL